MYIFISGLIEKHLFNIYFFISFIRSIVISNIKIYFIIKKNKLNNFSYKKLISKKKSSKLFILGCGSSINDLTDENWQEIKKNDTLGINRWILHEHVPNFLLFEGAKKSDLAQGETRNTFIYDVLNQSNYRYKNSLFLVKDLDSLYINFKKLSSIYDRIIPIYKLIPPGKSFLSAKKSIQIFKKYKILNSISFPFGNRGTITHAISLALNMGYEEIILCGIDLNGPYFWENNHSNLLFKPQELEEGEKNNEIHKTNVKEDNNVTVEEIISLIKDNSMKINQSIFISSKKSVLSKMFKVYW